MMMIIILTIIVIIKNRYRNFAGSLLKKESAIQTGLSII
jgi:hypothetical protein